MDSDEEMECCDTLEINQDVINYAKELQTEYTKIKNRLFQEILKDILLNINEK